MPAWTAFIFLKTLAAACGFLSFRTVIQWLPLFLGLDVSIAAWILFLENHRVENLSILSLVLDEPSALSGNNDDSGSVLCRQVTLMKCLGDSVSLCEVTDGAS